MEVQVQGLLNGRKPSTEYLFGEQSGKLAEALSARIDAGVGRSLCAHAMCSSSASGNVAVVRMLAARPMSTFNQAYNFGEPLRRACRAFVKADDPKLRAALAECALIIANAGGDPDQPDKYLKSGISAAGSLRKCGEEDAIALVYQLDQIKHSRKDEKPKIKKETESKIEAKIENVNDKVTNIEVKTEKGRKRSSQDDAVPVQAAKKKSKK